MVDFLFVGRDGLIGRDGVKVSSLYVSSFQNHPTSQFTSPLIVELFLNEYFLLSQGEKGNQGGDGKKGEPGICDIKVCAVSETTISILYTHVINDYSES